VALLFYFVFFVFILYNFIIVYFDNAHHVLVGLPRRVGGLAILY
jgi:hypothetical protein